MLKKNILLVVSNPSTATTTGWPVGFWAAELIHPLDVFAQAGYDVTIASPDGGAVQLDALSDPRDESGYSKEDTLSLRYLEQDGFQARLDATRAVSDCAVEDYDAIVVAGGQAPMFTFQTAAALQDKFLEFAAAGKVHAALCHGTSLLLHLKGPDGEPFVKGRRMTGFTNLEEDAVDSASGQKVMPFRIEEEAQRLGAEFQQAEPFAAHTVVDGMLVTGQQQNSGSATATEVAKILEASA